MIPKLIKWSTPITLLLSLSACIHWSKFDFLPPQEPVTPAMIRQQFRVGDTIKVYTLDQTIYEFPLVGVNNAAIIGQRQQIPFNEIDRVEKVEIK
ncbi:hypothetical protein THII_3079 [Thioploca ingrica]|uniref:Uncharacterized protein n=1 Tax=Thioploca ingrica TaxID=40754 RepID=A0A090BVS7_9GAMM|nr:hypothetical protein THII_3079 [Thioploca ingrica]